MPAKLKRLLSISITAEESNALDILNSKGVSVVAVFRLGLKKYSESYFDDISIKNN